MNVVGWGLCYFKTKTGIVPGVLKCLTAIANVPHFTANGDFIKKPLKNCGPVAGGNATAGNCGMRLGCNSWVDFGDLIHGCYGVLRVARLTD